MIKEAYGNQTRFTGVARRPRGFRAIRQGREESSRCAAFYARTPRKGIPQESSGEPKQARTKAKGYGLGFESDASDWRRRSISFITLSLLDNITIRRRVASSGFSFGMKSSSAESRAAIHAGKLSFRARNNFTTSAVSRSYTSIGLAAFRPLVVTNRGIVRPQRVDKLDFLHPHLRSRSSFGTPKDLAPNRKVAPLFRREVSTDCGAVPRSEIPERSRKIHPNVNLAVGESDFINPLHSELADCIAGRY